MTQKSGSQQAMTAESQPQTGAHDGAGGSENSTMTESQSYTDGSRGDGSAYDASGSRGGGEGSSLGGCGDVTSVGADQAGMRGRTSEDGTGGAGADERGGASQADDGSVADGQGGYEKDGDLRREIFRFWAEGTVRGLPGSS